MKKLMSTRSGLVPGQSSCDWKALTTSTFLSSDEAGRVTTVVVQCSVCVRCCRMCCLHQSFGHSCVVFSWCTGCVEQRVAVPWWTLSFSRLSIFCRTITHSLLSSCPPSHPTRLCFIEIPLDDRSGFRAMHRRRLSVIVSLDACVRHGLGFYNGVKGRTQF